MTQFGWFSHKMVERTGVYHIYNTTDGKQIWVTSVSNNIGDKPSWNDVVLVSSNVEGWVKNVGTLKF
jgi:hypothetical protein